MSDEKTAKEIIAKLYNTAHLEWVKAKGFRESTEPETHKNGFYQGMEWAYNKMLDELIAIEMVEVDGMTREEAGELLRKFEE